MLWDLYILSTFQTQASLLPAASYNELEPSYRRTHAPATASVALDRCPSAATGKKQEKTVDMSRHLAN